MGNEEMNMYKQEKFKQENDVNNPSPDNDPNPQQFVDKDSNALTTGILDKVEDQFSEKKRQEKNNLDIIKGSLADDIRKVYRFQDVLGGGQFGTVRTAYKKETPIKLYAIKSIKTKNLSQQSLKDLMREVEIISSLNHPNIVRFYETYHDKHFFHIVMELCTGTELFKKLVTDGKITEQMVAKIVSKILLAIAYCHSKGVTHRDLKPENVLIETSGEEPEVKIIDFGFSRKYDLESNEKMHTILGTPFYIAPEVLKGNYDAKCDVWSIGVLTYIMLSGVPPFYGKSNGEIFKKIVHSQLSFPKAKWEKISKDAISFIRKCLERDPEKRYSAKEAISDPWFKIILNKDHQEECLNPEILNNLKSFTKPDKFKTLILNFISNDLNDNELIKLKNAFLAIDTNHSGHISAKELEIAFKNTGLQISSCELNNIIEAAEVSGEINGKIEYNEFIMACMNQKANIRKGNLEEAFKYFDIDDSGFIESHDIKNALLRSGQKDIDEAEINKTLNEICPDNTGKISLETFLQMFGFHDE